MVPLPYRRSGAVRGLRAPRGGRPVAELEQRESRAMILNWHAHVIPPEQREVPLWQGRCPMSVEKLLEIHDAAGVDMAVVSNTIHYLKGKSDDESLKAIQRWDEYAATVQ